LVLHGASQPTTANAPTPQAKSQGQAAERTRLAREAAGRRSRLEREHAAAEREIERVVDGIARGILGEDDARRRIADARRRRDDAKAGLEALAFEPKVAELHPTAVATYLTAVDNLADTLNRRRVEAGEEIAKALRELIIAIVIHPIGREEPMIEVTGRLAKLTGTELFPQIGALKTAVAGAGIEPATYGL
jgi:site-specific DNA recombinase